MSQAKASSEAEALARGSCGRHTGYFPDCLDRRAGHVDNVCTGKAHEGLKSASGGAHRCQIDGHCMHGCNVSSYVPGKSLDNALPLAPKVSQIVLTADSAKVPFDEFEQTDSIWKIVKSFSLLVVKESRGRCIDCWHKL
ncbi:hypothetical protein MHU86_1987 [Fragilaria crotonensis]|nr:hypothetical protein MHU86_1987 [Fragilaria crotonensis]